MSTFTTRARERLADTDLRSAIAAMTDRQSDARKVVTGEVEDFDGLRDRGAAIRDEAIRHLPRYLGELTAKLAAQGVIVHRAATAGEANDIVSAIVREHGGPVVKGKSMLSEEIGLNERLAGDGIEVFETDLGEFIIQLAGEPPEHILAPSIHWSRERVRRLFEPLAGRPLGDDPAELVGVARAHLRAKFEAARVGITGGEPHDGQRTAVRSGLGGDPARAQRASVVAGGEAARGIELKRAVDVDEDAAVSMVGGYRQALKSV